MAIAVASTATTAFTAGGGVTVTKPSGLAVGDLMIALISAYGGSGGNATVATKSGWTLIKTQFRASGTVDHAVSAQYKVADSSDVAASNFVFSTTGTVSQTSGAMLRLTGVSTTTPIGDSDSDTGTSSSFSTTVTPGRNGCLLIQILQADTNTPATVSGYAVSDGTVTFTEIQDSTADVGSNDVTVGSAYGLQSTATALSTYSATFSLSPDSCVGILFAVNPIIDASGTLTHLTVSPTLNSPTGSAGTTGTLTHLEVSPTLNSPSGKGTQKVWTERTKEDATWTNRTK